MVLGNQAFLPQKLLLSDGFYVRIYDQVSTCLPLHRQARIVPDPP